MATELLVEVDAQALDALNHPQAMEYLEAVGYAAALRGDPFPDRVKSAPKKSYRTPQDIKDVIVADPPVCTVAYRVINAKNLTLPLYLRAAANIAAGGMSDFGLFNRMLENVVRFHLETKLGLFGRLLTIDVYSGALPSRIAAGSAYDISLTFDSFTGNLLNFKNAIDKLIEDSRELSTQKHAFEAMGRVLQKQFAFFSRDVGVLTDDLHELKNAAETQFQQVISRFDSVDSRFDSIDNSLRNLGRPDKPAEEIPPPGKS